MEQIQRGESMKKVVSTVVRMDAEQHSLLKRYSQAVDISMNSIFKEMLDENKEYFEKALKVIKQEEQEKEKQLTLM